MHLQSQYQVWRTVLPWNTSILLVMSQQLIEATFILQAKLSEQYRWHENLFFFLHIRLGSLSNVVLNQIHLIFPKTTSALNVMLHVFDVTFMWLQSWFCIGTSSPFLQSSFHYNVFMYLSVSTAQKLQKWIIQGPCFMFTSIHLTHCVWHHFVFLCKLVTSKQ